MLATIRAFAEKQLRLSQEDQLTRQRHLTWAVGETRRLRMLAPTLRNKEFDEVADDLRAALASAVDDPGEVPHQLARALGHLAYSRRFLTEAHSHFVEAARRAPTAAEAAADLQTASHAVYAFGHAGQAYDLLIAAAQQARAAGAGVAQTIALSDAAITAARFASGFTVEVPYEQLLLLIEEAEAAGGLSDPAAAAHLAAARVWTAHRAKITPEPAQAETALAAARAIRDPFLISSNYDAMGTIALRAGRFADAHTLATERLDLLEDMDYHDPRAAPEIRDIFLSATMCALAAGELPAAVAIGHRVFSDSLLGTHPYRATSRLVPALALSGDFDAALTHAERMLDGWEQLGRPAAAWMSPGMSAVALIHGLRGDAAEGERWQALAAEAGGGIDSPAYARNTASFASFVTTRVAIHNGQFASAGPPAHEVDSPLRAYAIAAWAEVAVMAGLPDAAKLLRSAKRLTAQNKWARACLLRAQWRLTGTERVLHESLAAWAEIGARFEHAYTSALTSGGIESPAV
jgi:tetratricopeptide (TPR) repeat protein